MAKYQLGDIVTLKSPKVTGRVVKVAEVFDKVTYQVELLQNGKRMVVEEFELK